MRREAALWILLFAASAPGLRGQTVLRDLQFNPPEFFVGDLAEMRIVLESEDPEAIEAPAVLPAADWIDIRDLTVEAEGNTVVVTIAFTSFAAGTRSLPAMSLGALRLEDIKIPTHSMLPAAHRNVRRLRGQLVLPGTRLALALLLGLAAMAPFLAYGLSRMFWNWFRRSQEIFRFRRPLRRLKRLLKKLRTGIGSEAPSAWFAELTAGLRSYLSERTGRDCNTATTAEITVMAEFEAPLTPQHNLLEVLHDGDMVKFAGKFADNRSLERTLRNVESAVADLEKTHAQL